MRAWHASVVWAVMSVAAAQAACVEREPNNSRALASPCGTLAVQGALSTPRDVDWYVLGGQQGTRAYFTIVHAAGVKFDLEVFSGSWSVGRTTGYASGDAVTCDIKDKRRCAIRVTSNRGQGPYTLMIAPLAGAPIQLPTAPPSIRAVQPVRPGIVRIDPRAIKLPPVRPRTLTLIPAGAISNEREPNGSMVQATPASAMVLRGTVAFRDSDWFALDHLGGKVWIFTITHPATTDLDFEVFTKTHSLGACTNVGSGASLTVAVPRGRCNVWVHSNSQKTGPYSVTIRGGAVATPAPLPPPPRVPPARETERNNQLAQATRTTSMELRGTIAPRGDVDWFLWTGDGGKNAMFTVRHAPTCNIDFEFFYPNGGRLGTPVTGIHSNDSTIVYNVPRTCAIRVWSPTGTGDYTFIIGWT